LLELFLPMLFFLVRPPGRLSFSSDGKFFTFLFSRNFFSSGLGGQVILVDVYSCFGFRFGPGQSSVRPRDFREFPLLLMVFEGLFSIPYWLGIFIYFRVIGGWLAFRRLPFFFPAQKSPPQPQVNFSFLVKEPGISWVLVFFIFSAGRPNYGDFSPKAVFLPLDFGEWGKPHRCPST